MKIGMIFPGQGSQFVGMAKEFYDKERIVQEYFDEATHCLGLNFVKLCFASSENELMETINAQTSIFLVSAAINRILKEKYNIVPDVVAGHSLGEYSALFAAGGINFPDALYLLKKRAEFMETTTANEFSGMLAVINLSKVRLAEIISKYDVAGSNEEVLEIVNYNTPTQFVVSGTLKELEKVKNEVKANYGKAIKLKVAGAFHSRLMKPAQEEFEKYLEKVDFHDIDIPLINNVDAKPLQKADDLKESLIRQVSSPILWWDSLLQFKDCDVIIQVGPGTKFSKMILREWPQKQVVSINKPEDIEELVKLIKPQQEIEKQENVEKATQETETETDVISEDEEVKKEEVTTNSSTPEVESLNDKQ
jgi:[acyl-carrier-protein] S-malonyltransferase